MTLRMRNTSLWAGGTAVALATVLACGSACGGDFFRRGDANDDGAVGVADAVFVLSHLFASGQAPPCADAADVNDDGRIDLSDAATALLHLFGGRPTLPPPFGACGHDPTADDGLACASSWPCEAAPHELLGAWLDDHVLIRSFLIWWEETKGWVPYTGWSDGLKAELAASFDAAWSGTASTIDSAPPNLVAPGPLGSAKTVLAADAARALYISLVAQSLVVEIKGLVPWSIEAYGLDELGILFDGRKLFKRTIVCLPSLSELAPENPIPPACTGVGLELETVWSLPAPGSLAYEFLLAEVGIGPTSIETIANLVEWCRRGMLHFAGSYRADVAGYYWGYRGAVPAARVMEGTDPAGFHPQSQEWGYGPGTGYDALFAHWTAGCHGTVTFMRSVLRSINLPVMYEFGGGHAIPHFMSDHVYLSHGDDPYNVMAKTDYPAALLLIDAATRDAWFGDPLVAGQNVGRQVKVLAAVHLPPALQKYRCDDLAKGLPIESGSVFGYLKAAYTLDALAAMGFWERIDAAIEAAGGCSNIH